VPTIEFLRGRVSGLQDTRRLIMDAIIDTPGMGRVWCVSMERFAQRVEDLIRETEKEIWERTITK
jgi:hypothetical protein